MNDPRTPGPDDYVLLPQTGIPEEDIRNQVEKLCRSTAFENHNNARKLLRYLVKHSLAGKAPRPAQTAKEVFGKKYFDPGDSQVRGETQRLRQYLDEHYASAEAQPGDIRLHIPPRHYSVLAPKMPLAGSVPLRHGHVRVAALITEPRNRAEVHQKLTVQGRIDALSLDLRVWLIVQDQYGMYYPQCRVSRNRPDWQHEVRIGMFAWGSCDGQEFKLDLVAADADGDAELYQYMKSGKDGFGGILPSDCFVLDSRILIRRDIRAAHAVTGAK